MSVTVRPARAEDSPIIARAFAMALGEDVTRIYCGGDNYLDVLCEIITTDGTQYHYDNVLVAESDGIPVGACIGYNGADLQQLRDGTLSIIRKYNPEISITCDETSAGEFYIDTVAVLPAYRGRGIGRELLLSMIDRAAAMGHKTVGLIVDADNTSAERLYTSLGFKYKNSLHFLSHEMRHLQRNDKGDK